MHSPEENITFSTGFADQGMEVFAQLGNPSPHLPIIGAGTPSVTCRHYMLLERNQLSDLMGHAMSSLIAAHFDLASRIIE